jgi:ferrochelatase
MPDRSYGVLLVAYGAPLSLDEVEPYLNDVRGGRPTSSQVLGELRGRYAAIGGRSPLLDRTREQAAALQRELGDDHPVYVGMRHWHPYIRDVFAQLTADGISKVVAVPLAPHFSRMSIGAYQAKIEEGRGNVDVFMVWQWHDHPLFLDAVAERVTNALERFANKDDVFLLFTAHSLPEQILADGDPYAEQLHASVEGVLERLGGRAGSFAFQSAGQTNERWLGPDAGQLLRQASENGARNVLICPIGFVADHLEVLYDVDVEYQGLARELNIRLERTDSLNDSPTLIRALADLTRRGARERGWQ